MKTHQVFELNEVSTLTTVVLTTNAFIYIYICVVNEIERLRVIVREIYVIYNL